MAQISNTKLTLLPAVDVADGQAVRLTQGAAGTETSYGSPLEAAMGGRTPVRSGSTSLTSMQLSVAVPISRFLRKSPAPSTSMLSCPVESVTMLPSNARCPRDVAA